jgi:hypothetical protein
MTVIYTAPATWFITTSEETPDLVFGVDFQTGTIQRIDGSKEERTYVNFDIPPLTSLPDATASSTFHLVIKNPSVATGSKRLEAFTIGAPLNVGSLISFNTHPFEDQDRGVYAVVVGGISTADSGTVLPSQFGQAVQLVLRPEGTDDLIVLQQGPNSGVFIEVRN